MDKEGVKSDISWVLGIAGSLLMLYVTVRIIVGPDAMVRVKMASMRTVSRTAKRNADFWVNVAGAADTAYMRARNTIL